MSWELFLQIFLDPSNCTFVESLQESQLYVTIVTFEGWNPSQENPIVFSEFIYSIIDRSFGHFLLLFMARIEVSLAVEVDDEVLIHCSSFLGDSNVKFSYEWCLPLH